MHNKFATNRPKRGYSPIRKIRHAAHGFWFAAVRDISVAYKVVLSGVTLLLAVFNAESVDVLIILIATGLVIMAELFNTAIEALCDFVEEEHDPRIGAIKDVAAAAAGVSIIIWLVVIVVEGWKVIVSAGALGGLSA